MPEETDNKEIQYRVLINNSYYLDGYGSSWEEADLVGQRFVKGKRMRYAVVAGGSNAKS